jgi:hypothetical protein
MILQQKRQAMETCHALHLIFLNTTVQPYHETCCPETPSILLLQFFSSMHKKNLKKHRKTGQIFFIFYTIHQADESK